MDKEENKEKNVDNESKSYSLEDILGELSSDESKSSTLTSSHSTFIYNFLY